MTEDKALDALAVAIALHRLAGMVSVDEWDAKVARFYRDHAAGAVAFLRDHPDVAQALGIFGGADPGTVSCQSCGWPRSAHDYGVFCR